LGALATKLAGVACVTRVVVTSPVALPACRARTSSGTCCRPSSVMLSTPLLTCRPHAHADPAAAESVTHASAEYVLAVARRTPGRFHSSTQRDAFPSRCRRNRSAKVSVPVLIPSD
jgi:hypothetical protein